MSDRRPSKLYVKGTLMGFKDNTDIGVQFREASLADIIAAVREGVESGTIEGPDQESISHALDVLRHGRETHVQWIDYLENENPDFDTQHVGDVEHHRWYLTGYDPAIALLELFVGPVSDGGSET